MTALYRRSEASRIPTRRSALAPGCLHPKCADDEGNGNFENLQSEVTPQIPSFPGFPTPENFSQNTRRYSFVPDAAPSNSWAYWGGQAVAPDAARRQSQSAPQRRC